MGERDIPGKDIFSGGFDKLFSELGYASTSTAAIAREAMCLLARFIGTFHQKELIFQTLSLSPSGRELTGWSGDVF